MTSTQLGFADMPDLMYRMTGDEKHSAAATSTLDVLWVLYDRVLGVSPTTVDHPERDRFLLSKGHGPMAFYAVLVAKGFLREDELAGWMSAESRLGAHPDRVLVPGAEIASGSLGHGLPLAVGTAFGLRAQALHHTQVMTLVGDGELDEGSNQEAIALAARAELNQLTAVMVDNASSSHGWPDGIERRFAVEGWTTRTVDGRNHAQLYAALTAPHPSKPLAVIAAVEPRD